MLRATVSAAMSCRQCGEQLPSGARFCGRCGASQDSVAPPPAPARLATRVPQSPEVGAGAPPPAESGGAVSPGVSRSGGSPNAGSPNAGSPGAPPEVAPLIGRTIAARYRLIRLVGE